jgi:hypothetical protein
MALNPLGLYHLTLVGEIHGQTTQNIFYFQTKSSSPRTSYTVEATNIVADFKNNVLDVIRAFACDDWRVKSLLCTTLIPAHTVLIEERIPTGEGFQPDDSLPSFCAGLLSLRTGVGGRRAHGRLFFAGVPENQSSDSRLEGAHLTLLNDIGGMLLARYGPSGGFIDARWGVYSRRIGVTRLAGPPPSLVYSASGFFPVTETIGRPEIATIRKRKLQSGQ